MIKIDEGATHIEGSSDMVLAELTLAACVIFDTYMKRTGGTRESIMEKFNMAVNMGMDRGVPSNQTQEEEDRLNHQRLSPKEMTDEAMKVLRGHMKG